MITATTEMEFIAGHRLANHEGKCKRLHGHNYRVVVTAAVMSPEKLDEVGRVLDFDVIGEVLGNILHRWDHRMLVEKTDPIIDFLRCSAWEVDLVPLDFAPTAENLARIIGGYLAAGIDDPQVCIMEVRVYETPTCHASWLPGARFELKQTT